MNSHRTNPNTPPEPMKGICTLDARGLSCPLPLLKMKLQLQQLKPGEQLQVLTTDDASLRDFESYCALAEHHLLIAQRHESHIVFLIEKGSKHETTY